MDAGAGCGEGCAESGAVDVPEAGGVDAWEKAEGGWHGGWMVGGWVLRCDLGLTHSMLLWTAGVELAPWNV